MTSPNAEPKPPIAARKEVSHEAHGDRRIDSYAWLRDTDDPQVLAHLGAERAYYDEVMAPLAPLVGRLADDMAERVPADDAAPPYPRARFAYLRRTPAGSEYEQLCRRPLDAADDTTPDVLVDPAQLIGDSTYIDLGLTLVSPDEDLVAYSTDTTGEEVFALRFRDTTTGVDLPDVVARTYYDGAWSADSTTFFYTVHDAQYRPFQVWRHRLGTDVSDDVLVLQEDDPRYELELRNCRTGDVIEIVSACRDTSEVWLVDARAPEDLPRCVEPRRQGVEYRAEHVRTVSGDLLYIVTNDEAVEFRLVAAPLHSPGRQNWREVVAEDPAERLYSVSGFAGHVVTTLRREGSLFARAYRLGPDGSLSMPGVDLVASIPVGTLELGDNELYDAKQVTVIEQSYTEPPSWYSIDLDSGRRALLKRRETPNSDSGSYLSERIVVQSGGAAIPVTVVRHADTPLDATAPCLLYGYGAYESAVDPEFDVALLSLLDRGVVYAYAGNRGGGEGGRRWWLDGRLEHKQNTFSDHLAVATALADTLVDGSRIVTRGLSAGGLLQGAVFSQAPDRWAGVVAEVPFVDVVTTMFDETVPLTVNEWDEWGDPRKLDEYRWMLAYSPYDNLPEPGTRPDLLATGAVHDPRVMVCEPAKWVAALRHTDPLWSPRCLFRAEVGAGAHVGPSGRYAHLRYEAEIYAWALDRFGLAQVT